MNGAYNAAHLPVGTNTLTVTAYSQADLGGTLLAVTTFSFEVLDQAVSGPPVIITEEGSDRAIAVNAATFTPGPFSLFTEQQNFFNSDTRTRVILFAVNFQVSAGTTIVAENAAIGSVSVPIEFIGVVPDFNWLTQIKIRLPDGLANAGDVWLRLVSGGVPSNQARITIKSSSAANTLGYGLYRNAIASGQSPAIQILRDLGPLRATRRYRVTVMTLRSAFEVN